MTDTARVEVIGKQLDLVLEKLTQHPVGLTNGEVALLAASIGAMAAIGAQVVIFLLTRWKEKSNLKKQLIAEERQTAYLLTEYYKELVMHKVHKQYWYRTSVILHGTNDAEDSHKRHFISNERSFETMNKIRITTSEYFKTVTLFTNLSGKKDSITRELNNIKSFEPRKSSEFDDINSYDELLIAQDKEEDNLNIEYLCYSKSYDKINSEMIKSI